MGGSPHLDSLPCCSAFGGPRSEVTTLRTGHRDVVAAGDSGLHEVAHTDSNAFGRGLGNDQDTRTAGMTRTAPPGRPRGVHGLATHMRLGWR